MMEQFLLFGDSITQQSYYQNKPIDHEGAGLSALLANAYIRKLDVVNRGFSGYNTKRALQVLPFAIPLPEVARLRFLVIFFGANDARLPNTPGHPQQTVALPEYKENLKTIVNHPRVRAHKDLRIILITPGPVEERLRLHADRQEIPDCTGPRRTALNAMRYAQASKEVAEELDIACLDLWTAMMTRAGIDLELDLRDARLPGSLDREENSFLRRCLHDGLHFTSFGYQVLWEELEALIARIWPDQVQEKLPYVLPDWKDEQAWSKFGTDQNINLA